MRTRTSRIDRRRAFSLVELLVVIAMLAVAATAIIPRMGRSIGQRGLAEAAFRLEQTARTTRELAVSRRQMCAIEIDVDAGAYGVAMASNGGEFQAVQASWLKQEKLPEGMRIGQVRLPDGQILNGGTHRIRFQPDGTSSGAMVQLLARDGRYLVSISPHNGRAVSGVREEALNVMEPVDLGD